MEGPGTQAASEQVVDAQLLLLERQLAAIGAVVDLIDADFRRLLIGDSGVSAEDE